MTIHIRKAAEGDAEVIAQMAQALEREIGGRSDATPEAMQDAMARGIQFWVAEKNVSVVAFVMTYAGYDLASATHGWHLGDIYVVPNARRDGVGRMLLSHVAQALLAEDGEWMSFTVLEDNAPAQKFYEALEAHIAPVHFMAFGKSGLEKL